MFDFELFYGLLQDLLNIDSVSGMYDEIQDYVLKKIIYMGFSPSILRKGGIFVDIGGKGDSIVVTSHLDTVGLMVKEICKDGKIKITPIGRIPEFAVENTNVSLYTLDGDTYSGTIRRRWTCIHITPFEHRGDSVRYEDSIYLHLDIDVRSDKDVAQLGIRCGDFIAISATPTLTESGYIKSYCLDNKVNAAIMLTYLNNIAINHNQSNFNRNVIFYFSMHEEVLHGGAITLPSNITEILSLDVCCVDEGQQSDEHKVSICVADSRFPYNRTIVRKLINVAQVGNIQFQTDVFLPTYGSDSDFALIAGNDIKHALIGPGVVGTHSYERTHIDGIVNTYQLMKAYIET